jgi:hypothetical protein
MRQTILWFSTVRKQSQKSAIIRRWSPLWLLLTSVCLSLLAACGPAASSTSNATSTANTATTGHIAGVIVCSALAQKNFAGVLSGATVKITSATVVAASGSTPESCKIDGVISPQIKFEVQLPTKQWSGDYFEGGCGGLCGMLSESADCQSAFNIGDVIAYNDMGHEGNDITAWGLNETQRQDFAYLANHYMAVLGKALIQTYYGRSASYSYFDGCSDGGREALMEAQRYPTDFNGIIAGAPAMYFSFLNSFAHAWDAHVDLDSSGKEILTSSALTVLHNAVMAACDKLDGVDEGLIIDPFACKFDPTTIECTATKTTNCLTAQQAEVAKKIYEGPVDEHGEPLYPGGGYAYGSEAGWAGMATFGESVADPVLEYLSQPGSTTKSSTDALDLPYTSAEFNSLLKAAAEYDATNADLSAFRNHGGKLILWHGLADPSIPSLGTVAYYQALVKQVGGLNATQQFARLFLFPGVFHCGNGYGPYHFDLVSAITNWVENGAAPTKIVATRYSGDTNGSPLGLPPTGTSAQGGPKASSTPSGQSQTSKLPPANVPTNQPIGSVVRTLPIFPYPQVPKYTGSGSVDDANNYTAVTSTDEEQASFPWLGQSSVYQAAPSQG